MKKITTILIAGIMLVVLTFTVAFTNMDVKDSATVFDLIAGQNIYAGSITVWNDADNLYVKYETVDSFCLTETHLEVGSSLDDIPQKNGNPIPGQFEYKTSHNCVSSFTYTVPLPKETCDLYIAAHAVVKNESGGTETAWGSGFDFSGKDWATYSMYHESDCQLCQTDVVKADFSKIKAGNPVQGMGVVAPNLNIDAKNMAVDIKEYSNPRVYGAPNRTAGNSNGGMASGGGFSDKITQVAKQAHRYTFTFSPGTSINDFSLHMLDFGDLNPSLSTIHKVVMKAFDANNNVVDIQKLRFTSNGKIINAYSPKYGDLIITGDAMTAKPGEPGNWTWHVSGDNIVKVILIFRKGFDPNIGFDNLEFTEVTCQ